MENEINTTCATGWLDVSENEVIAQSDELTFLFDDLFNHKLDLVQRNDILFGFFVKHLESNNISLLVEFFSEAPVNDLDVSLLRSALVVTRNVPALADARMKFVRLIGE